MLQKTIYPKIIDGILPDISNDLLHHEPVAVGYEIFKKAWMPDKSIICNRDNCCPAVKGYRENEFADKIICNLTCLKICLKLIKIN